MWKESIHTQYTGGKIFLIFDPTHVVKNIYNNCFTRRVLKLSDFPPLVPENKKPFFTDVEAVYNIECSKPLKIAHKLSETVLHTKSVEKVNVKLALSMLHESTTAGLKQYGFSETASALKVFAKLWSVLIVSSANIGMRKRDIFRDPVRSAEDWKLQFLLDFREYIVFWESSKVT